jgi:hypothetical protein
MNAVVKSLLFTQILNRAATINLLAARTYDRTPFRVQVEPDHAHDAIRLIWGSSPANDIEIRADYRETLSILSEIEDDVYEDYLLDTIEWSH